jgi:SAM-dependent methyltransferase
MSAPQPLRSVLEEKEILEAAFADAARGKPLLTILEAGCGRKWPIDLRGIRREITGVDLDGDALAHRQNTLHDLDHSVVDDLRNVSFPPGSFDVIYSSYVLEHVAGAEQVLDRFALWAKPGGLIILKIPARESVVGWLTRILPFRLHVAFYRYVAEQKDAGTPGHPPYPVFHEPVVSLEGIRGFCRRRGLRVRHEFGMDFGHHYRHLALTPFQRLKLRAIEASIGLVGALSLGSLTTRYSGLLFVIEKPA